MLRAFAAAGSLLVATSVASAAPPHIVLRGDTCGMLGDELRAALPDTGLERPRVEIEASHDDAFRATLIVADGNGRNRGPRLVTAQSCAELASSIAVIVEMVLEDFANTPAPVRTLAGQHVADPLFDERIEVPPRVPRDRELSLIVGGASATGGSLQTRYVIGGRVRRAARSIDVELVAARPDAVPVTAEGRLEVLRVELAVSPCLHEGSFAACGSTSVGVVRGSATALYDMRTVFAPSLAAGVRGSWERWLRGRVGFRLQAEGRVFATSTTFSVDHMPAWKSERFELSAGFAVLARLL